MAYSYKCSISFGLVYIPIKLHLCIKDKDIGFNMIDRRTHSRIQYKKTCTDCEGREVKQEDIVKGYEYEDGKYVIFDNDDFEKLKTQKDKTITIQKFVDLATIDPIYFDKAYYVEPTSAENAFALLRAAMAEEGKAGIAKTVLGSKEKIVTLWVRDNQMLLNTLFFADEVQKAPQISADIPLKSEELKLAKTLISNMHAKFEPEQYKDEYRERVAAAIESKIAGKEIVTPKEEARPAAAGLLEALQKSLEAYVKTVPAKPKSARARA
ncbi:MAG: Ku protein [Christensenellales bacterium]|jgi:DNA end-binding protein Ku